MMPDKRLHDLNDINMVLEFRNFNLKLHNLSWKREECMNVLSFLASLDRLETLLSLGVC